MQRWLSLFGVVLAVEVAVIALGWLIALATGDMRWVSLPALSVPPVAVAAILLWPRRP